MTDPDDGAPFDSLALREQVTRLYAAQVDPVVVAILRAGSAEALIDLFRTADDPSRHIVRQGALDVLYVMFAPVVRAFARRRGHRREDDLDDVVQAVFDIQRLAADLAKLPPGEPHNFAGWLLGRSRFKSGEAFRAQRRVAVVEQPGTAEDGRSLLEELDVALGDGTDMLEALVRADELQRVEDALRTLGSPEADMILLYHRDGLTWREVGERLGLSPDSCKQRASVARRRLRQALVARGQHG